MSADSSSAAAAKTVMELAAAAKQRVAAVAQSSSSVLNGRSGGRSSGSNGGASPSGAIPLGEGPVPGLLESEGSFQPADMSFRKRFSDADLSRRLSDTRLSADSSLDIGELRQTAKQRTMSLTALDSLQPTRKSKKHDQHSSQKKHEQKLDYTESMYMTEL
jgi:hypothetical protein